MGALRGEDKQKRDGIKTSLSSGGRREEALGCGLHRRKGNNGHLSLGPPSAHHQEQAGTRVGHVLGTMLSARDRTPHSSEAGALDLSFPGKRKRGLREGR